MLYMAKKIVVDNLAFLGCILLFLSSNAFFDFTASGLENPLAYVFLLIYVYKYKKIFDSVCNKNSSFEKNQIQKLFIIGGIILLIRHDLLLLILPSLIYVIFSKKLYKKKFDMFKVILLLLFPIILWSIFSSIYYGFIFPNTAYAKLNTGIDRISLLKQGVKYFLASLSFDTITLCFILFSLVYCLINKSKKYLNYLGLGVVLNLIYIFYIGGDFMQGRFFSYSYLICVVIFLIKKDFSSGNLRIGVWIALIFYIVAYPHTPLNSSVNYKNEFLYSGISDERGYYFDVVSLYSYFKWFNNDKGYYPEHFFTDYAVIFKNDKRKVSITRNIGIYGYWSGTKKIIIDPYALADPLLARISVQGKWRIGHFARNVPIGYKESLESNINVIKDKNINEFYKKMRIITQSKRIFSLKRLKTILMMNTGYYDKFLKNGFHEK